MRGLIYLFHGLFWTAFLVRLLRKKPAPLPNEPASARPRSTARAGPVLLVHALAFAAMYGGIGSAVNSPTPVRRLFSLAWPFGATVIVLGASLFAWSLAVFDSWRVLAKIDRGHRLCTRGPYRYVRNPIYVACDLLALGTFLWIPTWFTLAAVALMHLGSDLRARTEEKLLEEAFGEEYRSYRRRTGRFFPRLA